MADPSENGNGNGNSDHHSNSTALDIYPLSCYYFGSVGSISSDYETPADRLLRIKSNYDACGMRNCVSAVIVVELFNHPHLLLLQERNSIYNLPGGRLRPGESDVDGLKRKLSTKLSAGEDGRGPEWEVGECLGMWWRPDFESIPRSYLPPNTSSPKECTKLFLVELPESRRFIVPKKLRILAVPLSQLHDNEDIYGSIVSAVPELLSKYTFNSVEP